MPDLGLKIRTLITCRLGFRRQAGRRPTLKPPSSCSISTCTFISTFIRIYIRFTVFATDLSRKFQSPIHSPVYIPELPSKANQYPVSNSSPRQLTIRGLIFLTLTASTPSSRKMCVIVIFSNLPAVEEKGRIRIPLTNRVKWGRVNSGLVPI